MTSQTSKLAELAAPTRGRVKYAPLTAGLLARKGEAVPATPYYAAEALDLYTAGPIVVARHEPVHHVHAVPAPVAHSNESGIEGSQRGRLAPAQTWRMRRPTLAPEPSSDSRLSEKHEVKPPLDHIRKAPMSDSAVPPGPVKSQRIALSLDFDLDLIARLALHARHAAMSPAQLLEKALKEHLGHTSEICPTCARSLGDQIS